LVPRLLAFGCRFKVLNLALLCENFSDEFPDTTGLSQRFSMPWWQNQQLSSTPPIHETPTRLPTGRSDALLSTTEPTI